MFYCFRIASHWQNLYTEKFNKNKADFLLSIFNSIYTFVFLKFDVVGASVEAEVHGNRQLRLLKLGENYEMNSPRLLIRFLPVSSADWVGTVRIRCRETGLEAELCYRGSSFLGRRSNYRSIKGKIFESSSSKTIYEIDGHWDRYFTYWVQFKYKSFL